MIDIGVLKQVVAGYKEYFPTHWEDEKFKWEAIKHFQDKIASPEVAAFSGPLGL